MGKLGFYSSSDWIWHSPSYNTPFCGPQNEPTGGSGVCNLEKSDFKKKEAFLWMEVHSSTLLIFFFTFKIEDNLLCIIELTANSELT